MNNNSTNYFSFLEKCNKFNNIKSENEKYERCFKLIEESKQFSTPKENDKGFYFGSLAELYYYASKKEAIKYNLSDGITFDIDAILDERNRKHLEELIEYKKLSLENYKKCLEIVKNININNYDRITEGIRIMSQELSIIYYIIDDKDNFLEYGNCAIKYGSLNVISVFLKHYCEEFNYDSASNYFNLMHNYSTIKYGNVYKDLLLKIKSYPIYYNFLYESGIYEESLKVAQSLKKLIVNNDLIENKIKYTKKINEHIEKCKNQIEKAKIIHYKENKLKDYFDIDVLNVMSDDIKIYIATSLNIYEYIKSQEMTMDYSATLMPILKAIENIMFEIIAVRYHDFILKKDKKTLNKKYIPEFLNNDGEIIMKIDRWDYGQSLFSIVKRYYNPYNNNTEINPNKYFKEFCDENNVENSKDVILKIYNELEELRTKRNLVAHKDRIYEERVKECYDILLDNIKFINFLYTNFKFVFKSI